MPTDVFLCRYFYGWHERTDAAAIATYGRREAMLSLGAVQTVEEVDRIADKQLAMFARVREQITAATDPASEADTPYVAYTPGDTIPVLDQDLAVVNRRVVAMGVEENEHGTVTYAPQVGDYLPGDDEAFQQATRKMIPGTLAGGTSAATDATPPA